MELIGILECCLNRDSVLLALKIHHIVKHLVLFVQILDKTNDPLFLMIYNMFHENILGFCNNIFNAEGGTHITGFKTVFTTVINSYARELGILKEKDSNFTGADVRNGMTAIVSIKHPDQRFEGQTRQNWIIRMRRVSRKK